MSFLDNAGSIQIDAVLTELGRKRMSQGNFKVVKFRLGDDEIDYELFDPNKEIISATSSMGSGDEIQNTILSQSCLEAFSGENTSIKYGLTTFDRNDIFFVPVLKVNNKVDTAANPSDDIYYFSVNDETTTKLKDALGGDKYVLRNLETTKTKLIIESGLSGEPNSKVADLESSTEYREAFIIEPGLLDITFNVFCDHRLVNRVFSPALDSVFKNKSSKVLMEMNFDAMIENPPTSLSQIVDDFNCYIVRGTINDIVQTTYSTGSVEDLSALNGPRGTALALNFGVKDQLTVDSNTGPDDRYYILGETAQTLFGGSDKYDYIDTTVYIEGLASTSRIQIPLRIIRYAGT